MGKSRTIKYRILFLALLLGLVAGVTGCPQSVYVAVGDSITKGIGDNDLANGRGYPPLLKDLLNSSNLTIENAGKTGETSAGGASRIGAVLSQHSNASVVLTQYGTNDARANPPVSANDFKSNMQQIITAVKNAGAKPLLARIPPGYTGSGSMQPPCDDSSASAKAVDQRIRDYNQAILELVSSNNLENPAGGRLIPPDFYTNFKRTRVDNTGKSVEFSDCFHPKDEGYQSMARWWSYALKVATRWAYRTGDDVHSSPAIDNDGNIYVGSSDHKVYAFNPGGTKLWEYQTDGKVMSSPVVSADGTVYVGSNDGKLHAINASNGNGKWTFTTDGPVYSSPAIGPNGEIYVGSWSTHGKLYALKLDGSGAEWVFSGAQGGIRSAPAIAPNGTIYVGSMDGRLYAIKPNGTKDWELTTGDMVNSSPAIASDGTIYVGSLDNYLYAVDPNTHQIKWRTLLLGEVFSSPAIGVDGTIYVGTGSSRLHALEPNSGIEQWYYQTGGNIWSSPTIGADGTIYVGSSDRKVYAITTDGKLKWTFDTQGYVYSSPAVGADGMIYVGSGDHNLYAIQYDLRSTPSPSAPWPMFHHDRKHSGRQR